MAEYQYIAIEGNIGAGKTTFATRLAGDLKAALILEQFEENSFLPKFYADPARYAFPLELSFLADRYQQLKDHFSTPEIFHSATVSDYFIFKSLIFANQNLENTEFTLYYRLFQVISSVIPRPDLILYLHNGIEQLRNHIIQRGRPYEQSVTTVYLQKIQQGYFDFFRQQNDLRIVIAEVGNLDFVVSEKDYIWLKEMVLREYPLGITVVQRH